MSGCAPLYCNWRLVARSRCIHSQQFTSPGTLHVHEVQLVMPSRWWHREIVLGLIRMKKAVAANALTKTAFLQTSTSLSASSQTSRSGFQSHNHCTSNLSFQTTMAIAATTPTIVGALSCQKDSYLQTLETEVVACEEFTPPKGNPQIGKAKSKKATDPSKVSGVVETAAQRTWMVEFADSVLFPGK